MEYRIEYKNCKVNVREDADNFYIDFRTGLGEGIYPKSDWLLGEALEDQFNGYNA